MKTLLFTSFIIIFTFSKISYAYENGDTFQCVGDKTNYLYELKIVNIGDEKGEITIVEGGAPITINAVYKDGTFNFNKEDSISIIQKLYWNWSRATISYGKIEESTICCKM